MSSPEYQPIHTDYWQDHALCCGQNDLLKLFFSYDQDDIEAAKDICAMCSVAGACLNFALDNRISYGVWGGKDEHERKLILRSQEQR